MLRSRLHRPWPMPHPYRAGMGDGRGHYQSGRDSCPPMGLGSEELSEPNGANGARNHVGIDDRTGRDLQANRHAIT